MQDFHGYFTGGAKGTLTLFESADGLDWRLAEHPLASRLRIGWEDGTVQPVHRLERPQIWLRDSKPAVLFCACLEEKDAVAYNVDIPLTEDLLA